MSLILASDHPDFGNSKKANDSPPPILDPYFSCEMGHGCSNNRKKRERAKKSLFLALLPKKAFPFWPAWHLDGAAFSRLQRDPSETSLVSLNTHWFTTIRDQPERSPTRSSTRVEPEPNPNGAQYERGLTRAGIITFIALIDNHKLFEISPVCNLAFLAAESWGTPWVLGSAPRPYSDR